MGHQVEFLVDDVDAKLLRRSRAGYLNLSTLVYDPPSVLRIYACQHFHERGLARAVLTEQGVHLTRAQVELPVADRMHTGESLLDTLHDHQKLRVTGVLGGACG